MCCDTDEGDVSGRVLTTRIWVQGWTLKFHTGGFVDKKRDNGFRTNQWTDLKERTERIITRVSSMIAITVRPTTDVNAYIICVDGVLTFNLSTVVSDTNTSSLTPVP